MYHFYIYKGGMETKRRGRPTKGSAERKSESLLVKVDQREKQAFRDAAELAGVGLSTWVRERLRRTAVRELEQAARPIAFLENTGA